MTDNYIEEPPSRTFEQLLDERGLYLDLNKVYRDQSMTNNDQQTNHYTETLIRGIHDKTLLNQLFFSQKNIDNLDKRLRYTVYLMSNEQYSLGPQNKTELAIIMRSIYLTYANNINQKDVIKDQIKMLNDIVISKTAPRLLSAATQYLRYLEDANESHKILVARSINVNNTGVKTLNTGSALGF